jgi:very-short-patch-repair endonuclease
MSHLEEQMAQQIALAGLPKPEREFKAIPGRKFRFDFSWAKFGLLVEVQGGTWGKGAHSTGQGINRDTEKLNLATIEGWRVMQFTGDQIREGKALRWLQSFFNRAEVA